MSRLHSPDRISRVTTTLASMIALICLESTALAVAAAQKPPKGGGGNATVAGQPATYYPTINNLSIRWPITGDANKNGVVHIRYRNAGNPIWQIGMPLRRVPAGSSSKFSWANQHSGSIFNLQPGTAYEIELSLIDPDGGNAVRYLVDITRTVPAAPQNGVIHSVTPATFASYFSTAQPGDVFELAAGNYGDFTATRNGNASNPIVIRSQGDATFNTIYLDDRKFIILDRINASGPISIRGGEGLAITRIYLNAVGGFGITGWGKGCTNCYIADNTIIGPISWTAPLPPYGGTVGIRITGPGSVIEHNIVKNFDDAIQLANDRFVVNQYSIDIINNDVSNTLADGIEVDFCQGNCRVIGNRITNTQASVSFQPNLGEPTYAMFNAIYNVTLEAFKLHNSSFGAVIIHNTVVKNGDGFGVYTNKAFSRVFAVNNIFIGGPGETNAGYSSGTGLVADLRPADSTNYFNFNGYYSTTGLFQGFIGSVSFSSLFDMRSLTTETSAVQLDSDIFALPIPLPLPATPAKLPQDMRLKPGVAAIDAGLAIPGINDGFGGSAPDLGAYELNAPLRQYGPRQ